MNLTKRKEARPYQQECLDVAIKSLSESIDPVLLNVATGGGKSLLNSFLAEWGVSQGYDVLCITSFAELVAQNSDELTDQGNHNSIFCATLNQKKHRAKIVVATPQSLWSAIKSGNHPLKDRKFGLMLVDEVHRVNYEDDSTVYMKLINHYRFNNPELRLCGFSGSCMRGIDDPIYGEGKLFEKLNYSIGFNDLVQDGFLLPPVFGKHEHKDDFDYSEVKQNKAGRFDKKQLEFVAKDNTKTTKIIKQVLIDTADSYGVFIFCATAEQCDHVMDLLPADTARLITGTMNSKVRMKYMNEAKAGKVKYLVNINCLTTGINLPHFEDIVYLRLTESPVFFIQSIGRGSRLSPATNKRYFTVYDYAGNCDKFKNINDEALAGAILKDNDEAREAKLDICCPVCETMNTQYDRRCRGFDENSVRCEYMFIFRECPMCRGKCDVSAKSCVHCDYSLHDYNKHLNEKAYTDKKTVFDVRSQQVTKHFNFKAKRNIIKITYLTKCDNMIPLYFDPNGINWQKVQWKNYLIENGMPPDVVPSCDVDHIVNKTSLNLKTPKVIEATKNGKYYNLTARIY